MVTLLRLCPHCGEKIRASSSRCRFCNNAVKPAKLVNTMEMHVLLTPYDEETPPVQQEECADDFVTPRTLPMTWLAGIVLVLAVVAIILALNLG